MAVGSTLDELRIVQPLAIEVLFDVRRPVFVDVRLAVAGDQFEISVPAFTGSAERWHIRQDSLIWKE
jgi:hypothetical protein